MVTKFNYVGQSFEGSRIFDLYLSEDRSIVAKYDDDELIFLTKSDGWIGPAQAMEAKARLKGRINDRSIELNIFPVEYDDTEYLAILEPFGSVMCYSLHGIDRIILNRDAQLLESFKVSDIAERMRSEVSA